MYIPDETDETDLNPVEQSHITTSGGQMHILVRRPITSFKELGHVCEIKVGQL